MKNGRVIARWCFQIVHVVDETIEKAQTVAVGEETMQRGLVGVDTREQIGCGGRVRSVEKVMGEIVVEEFETTQIDVEE